MAEEFNQRRRAQIEEQETLREEAEWLEHLEPETPYTRRKRELARQYSELQLDGPEPEREFWAQVFYFDTLNRRAFCEEPEEFAEAWGVAASDLWRWGVFDERPMALPPLSEAVKIARVVGMTAGRLRDFYRSQPVVAF